MNLLIQCIVLCVLFALAILPAQYKNPLCQFASYPLKIKERIRSFPEYQDYIAKVERKNWKRKFFSIFVIAIALAIVAYYSFQRTFTKAFLHVFILFQAVNLYDLLVLDLIIFCHSKKLRIPGSEDMIKEYENPSHHIRGALIGLIIGTIVALISATIVTIFNIVS